MTRARIVALGSSLAVLAACGLAYAFRDVGDWDPVLFAALLATALLADMLPIETPSGVSMSAALLGLFLAMCLLGPLPALLIGVTSVAVDAAWHRPRYAASMSNLAAFALFPVLGSLTVFGLSSMVGIGPEDPGFVFVMLPGLVVSVVVNYGVIFVGLSVLDGGSPFARVRQVVVPIIPSELAMLFLASVIVYADTHIGRAALATLIALLFLYLWLYRELLTSQMRAEELDTRSHQLATLQVGVLTAMLRTLALRDHMTARHSAAVARYSRELARAAGCSDDEIELVHTAGLLHDIGKFIFPDHILLADSRLSDEDWEIVKCHPFQGAKIVREVDGYGPVADIILGHHERIDGKGYPRGMKGEEIPLLSRVISVCDTYDVMTARDSYREPVTSAAAIEELRRVAGKQLDARLVEVFIGLVSSGELGFRHGDDADFEAELQFERRVRDYAAPLQAVA
ncbi:MAG: HD-GYP domain-containing protein [Solirubrobacteraceae bacterium]|nr:HD-GYP domain-containing protein [Solirubrobacteraceae bacterium]